jgi:hypothetical protein
MGYGLPAAIAAKLHHPDRPVICAAGDGDFLMSLPELATAVQHGANIVVAVFDNGSYGTIRMHQERAYPGRVSGTQLSNPDFKAMAESFGAAGNALFRAWSAPKPVHAGAERRASVRSQASGGVFMSSRALPTLRRARRSRFRPAVICAISAPQTVIRSSPCRCRFGHWFAESPSMTD